MSSEARPSSGAHPTDDKGKRKRPESPSQDLMPKKSRDVETSQMQSARINSIKVRRDAAVRIHHIHSKKQEKESSPRSCLHIVQGNLCQYPQITEELCGAARWPTEENAVNHPDRTFDDLGNFRKFLRGSRDEAELAVYLGLQDKHDLRHFALSWPVLRTWIMAPHKQIASLKVEINHLIQDGKELSCIEDPYEIWPQRPQESKEDAFLRNTHIMAWHLI
ncbi:hypothetical protein N7463_008488 [Penicillium fimorum]|uniref:Uncharacterized protein n=1 Tax=Penicillium fimorum TaxID=1882269 RepID=A0A9W9XNZ3_9EURO|nr:hypothetical protein N7463_008488 [Penicillium fimorum]